MDQSLPDDSDRCRHHGTGAYSSSSTCRDCREIIKAWILEQIPRLPKFEAVVFTGSSGAAFGYWLADELDIKPIQVLKPHELGHGCTVRGLAYYDTLGDWLLLDDFWDTGATCKRVVRELAGKPVACLFWLPSCNAREACRTLGVPVVGRNYDYTNLCFPPEVEEEQKAILAPECPPQSPKSQQQQSSDFALLSGTYTQIMPKNLLPSPVTFLGQSFKNDLEILSYRCPRNWSSDVPKEPGASVPAGDGPHGLPPTAT